MRNLLNQMMNRTTAYLALAVFSCACSGKAGLGFGGGNIPDIFQGIQTAQAISPTSIQLSWNNYPGATKYNLYSSDSNNSIYQPTFTSYILTPPGADVNKTYLYSVTAVDPFTGLEQGTRSSYTPVKLLPHFNFKTTGSITATGTTSMRVNWTGYPGVSYRVYLSERLPSGVVAYNFSSATQVVSGVSTATVIGLQTGHEYCAIVVAAYQDQTTDGPDGSVLPQSVGISTTLSSPTWMVGSSGTFGDSKIANAQQCGRTTSSLTLSNLKVFAPKATLGTNPTFYVLDQSAPVIGNSNNVRIDIYSVDPNTNLSTYLGTRTGTGPLTTSSALATGKYQFYALVTDLVHTGGAQDRKEVIVGVSGRAGGGATEGTEPKNAASRQWVYVRSLGNVEPSPSPYGVYPTKQQDGNGVQSLGAAVAMGDFNCDGKMDLAIGMPDASTMSIVDNRPSRTGKVIIYFSLDASSSPTTSTRTQTITFDITGKTGDSGRDLGLGRRLYVGNFNNDNWSTNQSGNVSANSWQHCDDLAIGSDYGPLFVLYGKRDVSGNDGGLNYYNSTTYTVNPTSSCNPGSNVCEPAVYMQKSTLANPYNFTIGAALTSGDYNGDGYEDLVATSGGFFTTTALTSNGLGGSGVWVFRGSQYGLILPGDSSTPGGLANDGLGVGPDALNAGPLTGFPYLTTSAYTSYGGLTLTILPSDFGQSVATFKNSYYDTGNKRIKDRIVIGTPLSTLAYTCSGSTSGSTFSTDANIGFAWNCKAWNPPYRKKLPASNNTIITTGVGSTTAFGVAMTTLNNPLRYQRNQFISLDASSNACTEGFGNCSTAVIGTNVNLGYPGGVAISDPGYLAPGVPQTGTNGNVFVYYGVNNYYGVSPTGCALSARDCLGVARNNYFDDLISQNAPAGYGANTNAIQATNASLVDATVPGSPTLDTPCSIGSNKETCKIQVLSHPSTIAGSTVDGSFGQVIGSFPGNNIPDSTQSKDSILAIAAPFRTVLLAGTTYTNVGSVQLYYPNSFYSTNPITITNNGNCGSDPTTVTAGGVCRFSDGFSNSLTASLDYDGTVIDGINYGLGGIVGAPTNQNLSSYGNSTDILVGAPGYTNTLNDGVKVYNNGAGIFYFSHTGTYRNYSITDSGSVASPWHIIKQSSSQVQESNIKFYQAAPIGDVNSDGTQDVAVRISQGNANKYLIYSASTSTASIDSTKSVPFSVQGDTSGGIRFIPAGKITNTASSAFFVTGKSASYLYFQGVAGIVQGLPFPSALGGTPRKLFAPVVLGTSYLDFSDSRFYNNELGTNIDSNTLSGTILAHGDFNGDGIEDFALAVQPTAGPVYGGTSEKIGGIPASSTTLGRVFVFYGGSDNGFQTQADTNGGFPLNTTYFTDYSATSGSTAGAPCSSTGTGCKIQMIWEPGMAAFGKSIAAVPLGTCLVNNVLVPVSGLVVAGTTGVGGSGILPSTTTGSKIFIYKPACLGGGNFSGLSGLNGQTNTTLPEYTLNVPVAQSSSNTLGISMNVVSGVMGSGSNVPIAHLMIADQTNQTLLSVPVIPQNSSIPANASLSASTYPSTKNFIDFTAESSAIAALGARIMNYNNSNLLNGFTGLVNGFGNGISDVGDLNGDGYEDVGIGISKAARNDSSQQVSSQGTILVLFGGPTGFQTHLNLTTTQPIEPSRNHLCYNFLNQTSGLISSSCSPALVYAPQPKYSVRNGAYERTYLSPFSAIKFGSTNENLGSFVFGVPGRDSMDLDPANPSDPTSPAGRILNGGAFYVLP